MEKNTEVKSGLGFMEALTLLFIGLKLCGVINWPWYWILSPIWISIAVIIVIAIIVASLNYIG